MIDAFVKPTGFRSRRDLLRSVGVIAVGGGTAIVLGACSGDDAGGPAASGGPGETTASPTAESPDSSAAAADSADADESAAADESAESDDSDDGGVDDDRGSTNADLTVPKAEVPEGGGVIEGDFVITQPQADDFKAFSSSCTHQGCPVSRIADGKIMCNCHGSQFSIADGSVVNGPADAPLAAATVAVDGDSLSISA